MSSEDLFSHSLLKFSFVTEYKIVLLGYLKKDFHTTRLIRIIILRQQSLAVVLSSIMRMVAWTTADM